MTPELESILVDLGIADEKVRAEVQAQLARFSERYGAAATFLATENRGVLDVVLSDRPSAVFRVETGTTRLNADEPVILAAGSADLPGDLAGCEVRAYPVRLSDGRAYAWLCGLYPIPQGHSFGERFRSACDSLHRVLMINNLRLRYGRTSFARDHYWANEILPDLRLATAAGKGFGMMMFAVVPPVEYPPFWMRPEWIYTIANLGFWVRRYAWPAVTSVARFKIESFVAAGLDLDEAACRRAGAAVASSMGHVLGPQPDIASLGCSLEVRALWASDARELIDKGQACCIRELSHGDLVWPAGGVHQRGG